MGNGRGEVAVAKKSVNGGVTGGHSGDAEGNGNGGRSSSRNAAPVVWFVVQFRQLCQVCLAAPLLGLVLCLLMAVAFQFEHIQETACKVSEDNLLSFTGA